jgi:SPP1 family predicted phage head-tail adaptor
MTAAGDLRGRIHLQSRTAIDDGYGNEVAGPWSTRFTVAAGFKPRLGGEEVMAARLGGQQPWIITIRQSSETRQVTTDWRIVDARDERRVFNIRSIVDPDGKRAFLEILAQEGGPT